MSGTITYSKTLTVIECGECHIPFAIPASMHQSVHAEGTEFFCPNGHNIHYHQDENSKLKAQLDQVKADRDWQAARRNEAVKARQRVERSNIALRGHLTRWRKRVANGVCPVEGCQRHFPNLQDHVATKHPGWLAIHPEVFEEET